MEAESNPDGSARNVQKARWRNSVILDWIGYKEKKKKKKQEHLIAQEINRTRLKRSNLLAKYQEVEKMEKQ
ncbi:hypothetical protein RUM43_002422 [Polyplax serrata]|uniref:Uncharacterized protein n=1 Tax=Polyplax serrata TaxID=468196 RepID=A0AAN8PDV3_POLSC